jgi:hypothetical protein
VTSAALPALRESRGRVVNIASGLAHVTVPFATAYTLSKRGVVAYSDSLRLEHGDRITVPPRPGFVTVAGAVVNNNAFLWKPGRSAGDYVRLAGLDEAADASAMFVLRADGTVSSSNDRRGFFGFGGIDSLALQPGDAVVVPSQLDYETWGRALVRNLKDWSQIFSQFGLGAAAIKSLRQ